MFDNSKSFSGHLECNISDKTMKNITNIESKGIKIKAQ